MRGVKRAQQGPTSYPSSPGLVPLGVASSLPAVRAAFPISSAPVLPERPLAIHGARVASFPSLRSPVTLAFNVEASAPHLGGTRSL